MLETKETVLRLLDASKKAEGVQIFIGAESHLFGVAGCSVIIAPYQNSREEIVGAIGVIGPPRINYARSIPMGDYTAKVIGRLIGQRRRGTGETLWPPPTTRAPRPRRGAPRQPPNNHP